MERHELNGTDPDRPDRHHGELSQGDFLHVRHGLHRGRCVCNLGDIPEPAAGTTAATLAGVSCSDASDCTAVGGYTTTAGSSPSKTLAERWNGTAWALQTTPNPTSFLTFTADSCATSTACTAVGDFFAEAWSGTSWSTQTVPNPRNGSGNLAAVSCAAATTCTANGFINSSYVLSPIFANSFFVGQLFLPLAERYS